MKLSIITINYNNAQNLKKTVESVVKQSFTDYEYIIIDGNSTDSSLDIIKEYGNKIAFWASEKDNGIYHAMNKGLAVSQGEYVFMLNSGDFFTADDVLEKVFAQNPLSEIFYGDIYWDNNGMISQRSHPDKLSFAFFKEDFLSHQATFISRALHERLGFYQDNLKVTADWKFMVLAICKHNASYHHLPVVISQCDSNGFSNTQNGRAIAGIERQETMEREFSAFLVDYEKLEKIQSQLNHMNHQLYMRVQRKFNRFFLGKQKKNTRNFY